MSNMSYCRFRNTRNDLSDCLEALRDNDELSEEEAKAARWMFEDFIDFLWDEGIIEEGLSEIRERLNEYMDDLEERSE